ncbi:MAG TPA: AEC family transporter [Opitutus sp.]|nr:AEC family transporter [Opitutus sp.]
MVTGVLVLNTLAPVFLLIAIGAWLQRSGFVSAGFLKEANRLTYWLGLPALVFSELADSFHHAAGAQLMLLATVAATALAIVVAYATAVALRVPGSALGTFVQGAVRGNLAFVGLPVIFAMPDTVLAGGVSARAAAIVVVGPMMVANNVVAVVVLLLSQHRLGWAMVRPFVRQLLTTPPLLATIAGIGFAMAGWTLPRAVDKAFGALGEMALPLGLLGVGGSLVMAKWSTVGRGAWGAAWLKTAVGPALGWAVARAIGLGAMETKMVMIFMATPTAVVSYVMALELKGDETLASGAIVLSVMMSIAALAVVVGFF